MLSGAIHPNENQQNHSRPGFFSRFITKPVNLATNQKQQRHELKLQQIDQSIHWTINNSLKDWSLVYEIVDRISNSPDDQSQSIKVIKNYYLKYPQTSPSLISTIRLIVVLLLNSSDQFRLLAAKKLIKPLEDVFKKASKHFDGLAVQEFIINAFAVLAYEFQHHENLSAFTRFYQKIKHDDAPENGIPLVDSNGLFDPVSNNQNTRAPQSTLAAPPLAALPTPLVRDVRAEAEIARNHTKVLVEALAFTSPSEMDSNQIIQEFHSNCLQSQNQLLDDIPWATEQAARARDNSRRLLEQQAQELAQNPDLRPIGPTTETQIENTREEQLLELLLRANTELTAAFQQYDELERLAREEKEIKAVEERSKVETRLNPNSHGLLTSQGTDLPRQSGSSHPSPRHSFSPDLAASPSGSTEDVKFSSHVGYDVPDHTPSIQSIEKEFNNPELRKKTADHAALNDHHIHHQESPDDLSKMITPTERSEKALGKMRRISNGILHASSDPYGALDILQHQSDSHSRFESSNQSSSSNSSTRHLQ